MAKGKKDKQWYRKHYTENWRSSNTNPTNNQGELRCSGRVRSSCFICGTCRVTPVTFVANPVTSHQWGIDWIVITTMEHKCDTPSRLTKPWWRP
jgi:hypothetical protein